MTAQLRCGARNTAADLARAARVVRLPRTPRFTADAVVGWRARDLPQRLAYVTPDRALTWAELDRDLTAIPALAASRAGSGLRVATSGTTGPARRVRPRVGVRGALQLVGLLGRLPLRGVRTVASLAPLDHGHGLGTFVAAAALGATFVDLSGASTDEAVRLLRIYSPDLLTGIPLQLARLAPAAEAAGIRVSRVVAGSDVLTPALADRLADGLGAEVWNCYGSTETGTVCVADPGQLRAHPGTVGRPLPGVRLVARGDGLLEVRAPLADGPVALDRGHLAHGLAFVTGRADGHLVSGGELVDVAALEALLHRMPGVRAVMLDPVDVGGLRRFDVTLVVDPGTALTPDHVRELARDTFGRAHVPRTVTIRD
ncbi:AMP-binding protein [Mariniluteicoccus flavus]